MHSLDEWSAHFVFHFVTSFLPNVLVFQYCPSFLTDIFIQLTLFIVSHSLLIIYLPSLMFACRLIVLVATLLPLAWTAHHSTTVDTNPLIEAMGVGYPVSDQPQCSCSCHCDVPKCVPEQPVNPWTTQPPMSPRPSFRPSPGPTAAPSPVLSFAPSPAPSTPYPTAGTLNFPTDSPQYQSLSVSFEI